MGLFGDFIDDVFKAPGKIIDGALGMSSDVIAKTLSLPVNVVDAAIEAGCKTEEEIQAFAEKYDL